MNFKNIAITILIALACMTVVVWAKTTSQPSTKPTQWEYHVTVGPSTEKLKELGSEGWELIAIGHNENQLPPFYFKRPK